MFTIDLILEFNGSPFHFDNVNIFRIEAFLAPAYNIQHTDLLFTINNPHPENGVVGGLRVSWKNNSIISQCAIRGLSVDYHRVIRGL